MNWGQFPRQMPVVVNGKIFCSLDSLLVIPGLPHCIPASRLLRPYHPRETFLNAMKLSRICSEMSRAARRGEVYHLWWHPHNFGSFPHESMLGLTRILEHFRRLRDAGSITSLSMGEVADRRLAEAGHILH